MEREKTCANLADTHVLRVRQHTEIGPVHHRTAPGAVAVAVGLLMPAVAVLLPDIHGEM